MSSRVSFCDLPSSTMFRLSVPASFVSVGESVAVKHCVDECASFAFCALQALLLQTTLGIANVYFTIYVLSRTEKQQKILTRCSTCLIFWFHRLQLSSRYNFKSGVVQVPHGFVQEEPLLLKHHLPVITIWKNNVFSQLMSVKWVPRYVDMRLLIGNPQIDKPALKSSVTLAHKLEINTCCVILTYDQNGTH